MVRLRLIGITLRNLGTGPALNFRVWAKLRSEDGGVEATSGCSIGEAIGAGQKVGRTLDFSEKSFGLWEPRR